MTNQQKIVFELQLCAMNMCQSGVNQCLFNKQYRKLKNIGETNISEVEWKTMTNQNLNDYQDLLYGKVR